MREAEWGGENEEREGEMDVWTQDVLSSASRQMHPDRGGETEMMERSVQ